MIRPAALLSAALIALAGPAAAGKGSDQLTASVARELPRYGFDVDVKTLDRAQVAALHHALYTDRSTGGKRAMIKSILGGRYSLRGLLFGDR
ncbi:hypothetical protein ACQ5SP_10280 [Rhodovulum sp. YNF3179]|uniref:hypothetical protein n=1 Tax=Rhodovulum sp. YNF3179 TaxID=3425127 RepID=UPI003D34F0CA